MGLKQRGSGGADKQQVIVGEIYSQIKPELPLAPIIIITLGHGNERKFWIKLGWMLLEPENR